jgi:streptomycin 6-kinase
VITPQVPELDEELRQRLRRRFGATVDPWLDRLPPVLVDLADRWQLDLGGLIQRGTVSVVIRCRAYTGAAAILKVSPDRARIQEEAAALARWTTTHVPAVLAVDDSVGALLIEAIQPGPSLAETDAYPPLDQLAALVTSLHTDSDPNPSYRPLAVRIDALYTSGRANYERRPDLVAVVPPSLYERGRQTAMWLAQDAPQTVLLHGDLTPANILQGNQRRGLVAIDPAPCLGDPAFDAVDLLLWQAGDVETVTSRAEHLASMMGVDKHRLIRWCAAFAAMIALEMAEGSPSNTARIGPFMALAEAKT